LPADIGLVINSHLHFDHAGGNTTRDASRGGATVPTFPRARYVVQQGEYEYATHTNERTAGSYFPHNFQPVVEAGRFDFVKGECEIVRGITLMPTPGHTPHHQSIRIESDGEIGLLAADLVPTAAHLPLAWIMGYDVEPLVTLETKRRVLGRALEERWLMIFEHDATIPWGTVTRHGSAFGLESA